MLQPGVVIEGRYTLLRELGSGGMGTVWLARHQRLDAPFAIKFLQYAGANSSVKPRFYREARLASRLRGPHVPHIFDLGEWRGIPYILMEFLQGEDLRQRLDRKGFLSTTETLSLVVPVARVLLRAHSMGIVHRDLKPENIFLCAQDGEELVKVLDFGVAKVLSSGELASVVTRTNATLGTPYYMSPEQLRNSKEIDHRSDLWAFALLVFEMLTGRRAFAADSISQLVLQVETCDPPDPLQLRPELPPALRDWWRRAAARQPSERYQDAAALVDGLARALSLPVPGLATPDTPLLDAEPDPSGAFLSTESDPLDTVPGQDSQAGLSPPSRDRAGLSSLSQGEAWAPAPVSGPLPVAPPRSVSGRWGGGLAGAGASCGGLLARATLSLGSRSLLACGGRAWALHGLHGSCCGVLSRRRGGGLRCATRLRCSGRHAGGLRGLSLSGSSGVSERQRGPPSRGSSSPPPFCPPVGRFRRHHRVLNARLCPGFVAPGACSGRPWPGFGADLRRGSGRGSLPRPRGPGCPEAW